MAWTDHVVWWHVYPLGAVGAPVHEAYDPTEVRHTLPRLTAWLDYIVQLGADGLQLGPIFASTTHGYDTVDHLRIDPRLGDDADFDALVTGAHERGLKVMLDGVFNHVGEHHPLYRRALTEGRDSDAGRTFRIDWDADGGPRAAVFEGHGHLIALDHGGDLAVDLAVEVMLHWLRRGIDGWRLDAAYAVDPGFWARVLPRVRAEFPGATFCGEVIHGDYAAVVHRSTLDSVTQYELWKATWSALLDRNLFELAHALQRHVELLDTFLPMTFVGNHDVTRIASRVGADGAAVAAAVLLTVAGMPSLYYGDEQAFVGLKEDRAGGDDAVRPELPHTPEGLLPDGWWMYRLHQELIALRRRNPWLSHARTEVAELANERMVYVSRPAPGAPEAGDPAAEVRVEVDLSEGPTARVFEAGRQVVNTRR